MEEDTQALIESEDDPVDKTGTKCCHPQSKEYRYFSILFMCLLGFGSCFCYDTPGSLQDIIIKDMSLTTTEFSYLYSSYSWPNIVLCFVGGFLIDRVFGIRFGAILYAFIVVLGQIIFALGAYMNLFWLMIVGRLVFGIGGESLAVAQNYYAVLWFKGKELNLVFGLQLSFVRIGSAVNFFVMGPLYKYVSQFYNGHQAVGISLLIAGLTCVGSFLSAVFLACLDKKKQESERANNEGGDKDEEVARFSDIKDFPVSFWLITAICISYYAAIFPFIALGKVFFIKKFGLSADMANTVNSLIYIVSGVASPLWGIVVDKTGRNVSWVIISVMITLGAHSLLAFTFMNPWIPMITMGLAYSLLASALWPMISLVIPDHQLGSGYGVAQALQNLGLAITTWCAGMVVDSKGYLMLEVFFIGWLGAALISGLLMWLTDMRSSGILNMTMPQRELFERNKMTSEMLQREGLLASTSSSPYDVTFPQSVFNIRNRYLARIGAMSVPVHVVPKGYIFRSRR